MALAILIWFLAAMSLLVGSIVYQARTDSRLTQLHLGRAKAQAAADGAIQLVLAQRMQEQRSANLGERRQSIMALQMRARQNEQAIPDATGMYFASATVGDITVHVLLTPLAGLIDLNNAPEPLLGSLFTTVAELEEDRARELAMAVVARRSGELMPGAQADSESNDDGQRYETIEDLMRVEGMDRGIFDAVRDTIYVAEEGSPGVDWQAAPAGVLQALGAGDRESAREIATARMRGSSEQVSLPSGVDLSFQGRGAQGLFRADAMVQVQGFGFLRRRWVDTTKGGPDGLPWNYFRTERLRGTGEEERAMIELMKERDAAI